MNQRPVLKSLAVAASLLVLVVFSISDAFAAQRIRVATVALPETTIGQGLVKWKELLEQRSGGKIEVKILDRAVMGGDREMIEACRLGTLDSAIVSGSVIANVIPEFFMIPLPYLFNDHNEANAFLDGPMGQKLFSLLPSKNMVGLGWATWSFRGIWNVVRPITKPEDLKGMKIRTVETPLDMATINYMGGVATPMAWSEALLGMRQGTVDGISTTYGLGYYLKLYEMSKFASQTKHYYETAPLIMSKAFFDGLSPADQKLVKETAADAMRWARKEQAQYDEKSGPLLEEKGVKVNSLSTEAFEAFRKLTRPTYGEFKPKIGEAFMNESMSFIENLRKNK
jgi:tripartite ATP-independent transporter DctP family solute receptor